MPLERTLLGHFPGDRGRGEEIKMLLHLQIEFPILFNLSLQRRIDIDDIMMGEERPAEQDVEVCIFGQRLIDPELDTGREVDGPDVEIQLYVSHHRDLPPRGAFDFDFAVVVELEVSFQLLVARLRHHTVVGTRVEFRVEFSEVQGFVVVIRSDDLDGGAANRLTFLDGTAAY